MYDFNLIDKVIPFFKPYKVLPTIQLRPTINNTPPIKNKIDFAIKLPHTHPPYRQSDGAPRNVSLTMHDFKASNNVYIFYVILHYDKKPFYFFFNYFNPIEQKAMLTLAPQSEMILYLYLSDWKRKQTSIDVGDIVSSFQPLYEVLEYVRHREPVKLTPWDENSFREAMKELLSKIHHEGAYYGNYYK
jgi:hypothetical protein